MSLPLRLIGYLTRTDVPDLTGKVAVVTGFNSGIGYETTRSLLDHNAEVIRLAFCYKNAHQDIRKDNADWYVLMPNPLHLQHMQPRNSIGIFGGVLEVT